MSECLDNEIFGEKLAYFRRRKRDAELDRLHEISRAAEEGAFDGD